MGFKPKRIWIRRDRNKTIGFMRKQTDFISVRTAGKRMK